MERKHVFYLSILGGLAILAVLIVQLFWVRAAININESHFERTVTMALTNVAEKISADGGKRFQQFNPVKKIDPNNYIVEVNSEINAELLHYYLIQEFNYFNIEFDFEYGIYDCYEDEMVFCDFIRAGTTIETIEWSELPTFDGMDYYFSVSFPTKPILAMHNTPMWAVTSFILMLVILFFIYAMYVVMTQQSASRVQRDFINNMTHEFKTPISTISVIQEVLATSGAGEDKEKRKKYLGIIGTEAQRLNEQVEKVLNITRVEKKTFDLYKEGISLHELMDDVTERLFELANSNDITIEKDFSAEDDLIKADSVHFTNVLFNLIDNAIKYAGKGSVISLTTEEKPKNLILTISDNGVGMDPKDRKRIFDKFYRVSTGNVHNVKGFGLGLFYVKKVIDAHGWNIQVQSEKGKGTTFTIKIPKTKN